MLKRIFSIIMCSAMILLPVQSVSAVANTNAWSVGTNYKDGIIWGLIGSVDTSEDATTAADYYATMGYSSAYSTSPTYTIMRGKFSNGNYRMESAVQFYSGHANYQCVAFNYNKLGGDYLTGVYYDVDFDSTSTGYKYAGIKSYNLSNVKLITFAGCNTASNNNDNIAYKAQQEGASTTVGWTVSVGAGSHTSWLKRYNDYLNKGYTVEQAISHADSFSYTDNSVKKHKVYGNKNLTLSVSKKMVSQAEKERTMFSVNYKDENEIFNEIKNFDKDFNINNYVIDETSNEIGKIYDLYFTKNGYKTLEGYTIILSEGKAEVYKNDSSSELFDVSIPEKLNSRSYSDAKLLNDIQKISGNEGEFNILSQEIIFDIINNRELIYYRIENILENGATAVIEYYEEV